LNILLILFLTIYHFTISIRSNPYLVNIFQYTYTYEDKLIKSLDRKNWDKYITRDLKYLFNSNNKIKRKKIHNDPNILFDVKDIQIINNFLNKKDKMLILNNLSYHPYIHTLINRGYVAQIFNEKDFNFYLNSSISYNNLCVLAKNNFLISDNFELVYKNKNDLSFKCQKLINTF